MNIEERAEMAANLKKQGRCNCCQAVVYALADETDLPEQTLMELASGFAVGMGTMENTCGALIGASMVAGLKMGGAGTVRVTRQMSEEFRRRCGALICKDLKSGTPTPCEECVRNAVLAYGDIMNIS